MNDRRKEWARLCRWVESGLARDRRPGDEPIERVFTGLAVYFYKKFGGGARAGQGERETGTLDERSRDLGEIAALRYVNRVRTLAPPAVIA